MPEGASQKIVNFIADLSPLYIREKVGDAWAARSLIDGTLILPISTEGDDEDGMVVVRWPGDQASSTKASGIYMATNAVVRCAEVRAGLSRKDNQAEYIDLAERFEQKTERTLSFGVPDRQEQLTYIVEEAAKEIGKQAVLEIVKVTLFGC